MRFLLIFNRPTRFGLKRWFEDAGFQGIVIKPGSSATKTVCTLFPGAVRDDLLGCCNRTWRDILADARKQGWHVVVLTVLLFGYIKIFMTVVKLFCFGVTLLVDRGPHDEINLPDGWIALATKPGKYNRRSFKDKAEFIKLQKI
jgi:hypothetical protein